MVKMPMDKGNAELRIEGEKRWGFEKKKALYSLSGCISAGAGDMLTDYIRAINRQEKFP